MNFPHDEMNLMAIYANGSREGLIKKLNAMREYLEPDETELLEMTDSVLKKLSNMPDAEFNTFNLIPDFDETEDLNAR